METRYKEIMDHITLTEEMRRRILQNIRQCDQSAPARSRATAFPVRRVLGAAACFALVLTGILTMVRLPAAPPDAVHSERPPVTAVQNMQSFPSAQALSGAVGFTVEELESLPFAVSESTYTAFGADLAEIKYIGDTQSAVYRKAAGQHDPSGDYTQYDTVQAHSLGGTAVTLSGTQEGFCLARWQKDGYSYSLRLNEPAAESVWTALLQGLL